MSWEQQLKQNAPKYQLEGFVKYAISVHVISTLNNGHQFEHLWELGDNCKSVYLINKVWTKMTIRLNICDI